MRENSGVSEAGDQNTRISVGHLFGHSGHFTTQNFCVYCMFLFKKSDPEIRVEEYPRFLVKNKIVCGLF